MIDLDFQQEESLRQLAVAAGHKSYGRLHKQLRWLARFMLSVERFCRPAKFKAWDDARKADYQRERGATS